MTQLDPEVEAAVAELLKKISAFASGESHACPTCGAQIETITLYEKSEPEMYSLYTQPCNHRHGLWKGAPDWAVNAGIVHVIPLEVENDEMYLDSDDDLDDDFDDDDVMRFTCSACAGTGQDWDLTPCQECDGEGFYYWK